MDVLLTIGITSYKRIKELERCINSIKTKYNDEIEVLVSEDKSPLSSEIEELVHNLSCTSNHKVFFSTNTSNLGYDMNLGEIIKKSHGKFIFFMSDDDFLADCCLDNIIERLRGDEKHGVLYAPFIYSNSNKRDRVRGKSHEISAGEDNASKYLYDSILFSGLIFRKSFIEKYDSSRFRNLNYFQVYLFLEMIFHYGGYFFENPSVVCVGDGENAYGVSESSGGNAILANRKSVKSNLEFNKTLIKVIKMFDADEGTNVFESFQKQYSIHSYSGLSIARESGIKYYKDYWNTLTKLDLKIYPIAKVYYVLLYIFGKKIVDVLLFLPKKLVKKD